MAKAIALLSGGLDSTLAILMLLKQGIEVTAITFLTNFGCDISDTSSCSKNPFPASQKYGFKVKLCHLADRFLDIVKDPKYGHGKNMNPCIDCRILMLKESKRFKEMTGADFLVTGEVLGQRPMSQRRHAFQVIDREANVEGIVLRPLSAKLLKPTTAEVEGLVDRTKLCGLSGRSRKPQIVLAGELGLTDYPAPAGGCLLTEPIYSHRLRDLLEHNPDPAMRDINLLRIGRHFRVSDSTKIIVGRNEKENMTMESLSEPEDHLFHVQNFGSPVTLVSGPVNEALIRLAASLTARYSDAKHLPEVEVTVSRGSGAMTGSVLAKPATDSILKICRIQHKSESGRDR